MGLNVDEDHIATDLHNRGYAVFDFPDANISSKIDRIRQRLSPRRGIDFVDPASDGRIQDAWTFDEDVGAIATNASVLEPLSRLCGRRTFPFQTLNFPVGTQQAVHLDSVHFSSLPKRFMCSVWLAMEDIGVDQAPLLYLPGSYKWPIVTNALMGRRGAGSELVSAQDSYGPAWDALCDAYGTSEETFLGGSTQANPTLTRWSQVTRYYFEDCIYYTPAFSDEALGQLDLRNLISIEDGKLRLDNCQGEPIVQPAPPSFPRRVLRALKR